MLNLFLAILLGNFDQARNLGEKTKIFVAFNSITNEMDFELNAAIGILFDDADFTRYIEDKIIGNKKQVIDDDNEDRDCIKKQEHKDEEFEAVFYAMNLGTIEYYLSGERQLDDPFEDEVTPEL